MDLLDAVAFDMELAGAELLGRDVVAICSKPVLDQVRSLLTSEHNRGRLVNQMVQTSTHAEAAPAVDRIVDGFLRGLLSAR
jgi:predicted nucleotidyltransferase